MADIQTQPQITEDENYELDLSNPADLEVFSESAMQVFQEAAQFEAVAQTEGYEVVAVEELSGQEMFAVLNEKYENLTELIDYCNLDIQTETEIPDDRIENMQAMYDDLLLLRDHIENSFTIYFEQITNAPVAQVQEENVDELSQVDESEEIVEEEKTSSEVVANEEIERYRVGVRAELATLLKEHGATKIKKKLDRTIGQATTIEEIDQVKQKMLDAINAIGKQPKRKAVKKPEADAEPEEMEDISDEEEVEVDYTPAVEVEESDNTPDGEPELLLEDKKKRKDMDIGPLDQKEESIKITVSKQVAGNTHSNKRSLTQAQLQTSPDHDSAIARAESQDPINQVFSPKPQVRSIVQPRPELAKESLTQKYLMKDSRCRTIIDTFYTSPDEFEKILDLTVTEIEQETTDSIERWLKVVQYSAFDYLKDMKMSEIEEKTADPRLREDLKKDNVKYETLVEWIDLIPEMKELVPNVMPGMKFGELYARWMVESALSYAEQMDAA